MSGHVVRVADVMTSPVYTLSSTHSLPLAETHHLRSVRLREHTDPVDLRSDQHHAFVGVAVPITFGCQTLATNVPRSLSFTTPGKRSTWLCIVT